MRSRRTGKRVPAGLKLLVLAKTLQEVPGTTRLARLKSKENGKQSDSFYFTQVVSRLQ